MTGMKQIMRLSLAAGLFGLIGMDQAVRNIFITPATHTGAVGPERGRTPPAPTGSEGDAP